MAHSQQPSKMSILTDGVCVSVAQSCPTLCDLMDCSPPGSSVRGILQARILVWAAIPFSRGSSRPGIEPEFSALQADSLPSEPPGKPNLHSNLSFQIWQMGIIIESYAMFLQRRAAHQAPPSLGFSRQEDWSGLPFPSPMHESEK